MGQADKKQMLIASSLTIISTFLMGMVDAYTFTEQDGSFASAQTGNLVMLSVKVFTGHFDTVSSHIIVFVGYAMGAFIGEAVLERIVQANLYKSRVVLLLQTILLGSLASFQTVLIDSVMIFCLGLLAGYEITVFRTFKSTTVNNGIMTGNTKNMMHQLYQALFNKSKAAREKTLHFLLVILTFMLGAGTGVLLLQQNQLLLLWTAFLIVFICFLLTFVRRKSN